jgi:hypothetical protein
MAARVVDVAYGARDARSRRARDAHSALCPGADAFDDFVRSPDAATVVVFTHDAVVRAAVAWTLRVGPSIRVSSATDIEALLNEGLRRPRRIGPWLSHPGAHRAAAGGAFGLRVASSTCDRLFPEISYIILRLSLMQVLGRVSAAINAIWFGWNGHRTQGSILASRTLTLPTWTPLPLQARFQGSCCSVDLKRLAS